MAKFPKIIQIIQQMPLKVRDRFILFLRMQEEQVYLQLFVVLQEACEECKEASVFQEKSHQLHDKMAKITHKKDFSEKTFSYHQTNLVKFHEKFIREFAYENSLLEQNFQSLKFQIERGRKEEAQKIQDEILEKINELPVGLFRFRTILTYQWEDLKLQVGSDDRSSGVDFRGMQNALDAQFISGKLKFIYAEINIAFVYSLPIPEVRLESWARWITCIQSQILIGIDEDIYFLALLKLAISMGELYLSQAQTLCIKWPEDIGNLDVASLDLLFGYISEPELRDMATACITLSIYKVLGSSKPEKFQAVQRDLFELYLFMLVNGFLTNSKGKVDLYHFKNFVKVGCKLDEFEIVHEKMKDFASHFSIEMNAFFGIILSFHSSNENDTFQVSVLRKKWANNNVDHFFKLDLDIYRLKCEWELFFSDKGSKSDNLHESCLSLISKVGNYKSVLALPLADAYTKFATLLKSLGGIFFTKDSKKIASMEEKIKAAPYCVERPWLWRQNQRMKMF